jgi:AcrR family transcriptional regulator
MHKHNKKYWQLLNTGKDLFWKFGIRRVTVEEICTEAKVSKMTFYKFFTNKTDLVKHIIDHLYDESLTKYLDIINSEKPYKDKVTEMAMLKFEGTDNISHEFLTDYYALFDNELSGYLKKKFDNILKVMLDGFIEAQKNGDIRDDVKPEFIIYFINHMMTMAGDSNLKAIYPDARELIMELMNFFFYGIMQRNNAG